ncbi:hypothetical protein HDU96_004888 [Phlyctochytrium bullatum]|nr:hypothetical protein HDU96_004888 [Phlyctochytrium bullatum]
MSLQTLPVEALLNIIRHLHPSSLPLLAAACRRLRRTLDATVLTYSFAKEHLELVVRRPIARILPDHRHPFDLPMLASYALVAVNVFGFSRKLLEVMWGNRWTTSPAAGRKSRVRPKMLVSTI